MTSSEQASNYVRHPVDEYELETHTQIDPITGDKAHLFFHNGRQCSVAPLTGPLARRYAGYDLICDDLDKAKNWLTNAHRLCGPPPQSGMDRYIFSADPDTFVVIQALWFGAIVTYAKCFVSTDGRGTKLDRNVVVPEAFMARHDKIVGLRHNLVAHAGVTDHELAESVLVLSAPEDNKYWIRTVQRRIEFEDDRSEPVSFAALIDSVAATVRRTREEARIKIRDHEIIPKGVEHWCKVAGDPQSHKINNRPRTQ